ncbi:hypothetical protein [Salipiger mangrovisoli]|uniref:Uncharacterized protein n=1 Tax=Salipiger mangrovisoli TaxID=2865933 RepID=A0ABR9WZ59_9RHOB|nr:hypothetical protein [Salipiger mangrovisoli]MBE9636541.1 hypothetical protein [Salipiger mangrovisoli]
MLDQKETPSGELGAQEMKDNGTYGFDITDTFDCTIEAFEAVVDAKRAEVAKWNDRVAAYREKTDKPLPRSAYREHPAFCDLYDICALTYVGGDEEEIRDHVAITLSKVSKSDDGSLLFDGRGRDMVKAWMDAAVRTRNVASERGDIATCGAADQIAEWAGYLDCLLWEEGPVAYIPAAIAIREAQYG